MNWICAFTEFAAIYVFVFYALPSIILINILCQMGDSTGCWLAKSKFLQLCSYAFAVFCLDFG